MDEIISEICGEKKYLWVNHLMLESALLAHSGKNSSIILTIYMPEMVPKESKGVWYPFASYAWRWAWVSSVAWAAGVQAVFCSLPGVLSSHV